MFLHVEISTHCNFTCFYCAGREMKQRYMSLDDFVNILDKLPTGNHVVCLQGEGEPTIHPDFWAMAELLQLRKHTPYTITNGSCIDAERIAATFPRIAVSLDTLDPIEADRIGRKNLPKVLRNIDRLLEHMGPRRVIIASVDYGQPLDELKAYVQSKGITEHMVQPLQVKDHYRKNYENVPAPVENYTYQCRYLEQDLQRTYDLDGHVYPCCYIKNPAGFISIDNLRATMQRRELPECCRGCREILADTKQAYLICSATPTRPTISFIVPVKSRIAQLKRSLPTLVEQPNCEVIIVDFDCPQGSGEWAAHAFPNTHVIKVRNAPMLNLAQARNVGARHASAQWFCFLDVDAVLPHDFSQSIVPRLISGTFSLFSTDTPGLVICDRDDFNLVGGYDETFEGWGCEDNDLVARLQFAGRQGRLLPETQYSLLEHDDSARTQHYSIDDKWLSLRINGMYFQIKTDIARSLGIVSLPANDLRQIYMEVKRVILGALTTTAEIRINLPLQVGFRQPPGWLLKREWIYRFEPNMNFQAVPSGSQ